MYKLETEKHKIECINYGDVCVHRCISDISLLVQVDGCALVCVSHIVVYLQM